MTVSQGSETLQKDESRKRNQSYLVSNSSCLTDYIVYLWDRMHRNLS